MNLALVTIN